MAGHVPLLTCLHDLAGSNEIMRNVIAERALGMPREAVGNSGDAGRPG